MISQGVPEAEAVEALIKDMPRGRLKENLRLVLYRLKSGESLSASLSEFPRYFPEGYLSIVEAGERTGDLPRALGLACASIKRRDVSQQRIFLGILLPLVTTVICFGLIRFLQIFALPYLREMLDGISYYGQPPLEPVRLLHLFDGALIVFACLITPLLLLFFAAFYRPAFRSIMLYRFCNLLQIVLKAGLPLQDCHRLARKLFSGRSLRATGAVDRLFKKLYAGESVGKAFATTKYFRGELSWMIAAGESKDDIPGALSDAADFYDLKADSKLSLLFNVAPPVITIAIAIPIAIVAASVVACLRWYLNVELMT